MVKITGVPEKYRVYMYGSLVMMLGGVVLFIISLFGMNEFLLGSSLMAVGCGFFLATGMAIVLIRKKKKDSNTDFLISTFTKIVLLVAFALSLYLIIFAGFFALDEHFSGTFWVVELITIPVVIISLIVFDILLNRETEE